jgi:hypothetical protein
VIERRAFLVAAASAATVAGAPAIAFCPAEPQPTIRTAAPFATQALSIARSIAASTGGACGITIEHSELGFGSVIPQTEDDIVFGTLDALTNLHPGFAYFAGLPGTLGMPDAMRLSWMANDGASLWQELQHTTGYTCLIAGVTRRGADLWSSRPIASMAELATLTLPCEGITASVLSGLGVTTGGPRTVDGRRHRHVSFPDPHSAITAGFDCRTHHPYCARNGIAQHSCTLALVIPRRNWVRLSPQQRTALRSGAMIQADVPHDSNRTPRSRVLTLPVDIQAARNRVAEAVLADLSSHDALTQRINRCYFAARRNLTT